MPRKKGMAGHEPGSHQGTTDVWLTPPPVLDALGGAQSFDLDPCAAPEPRPWRAAVAGAFMAHGGQATLEQLYTTVRRPTGNPHWKEQVRKQAQRLAERVGPATYVLRRVS